MGVPEDQVSSTAPTAMEKETHLAPQTKDTAMASSRTSLSSTDIEKSPPNEKDIEIVKDENKPTDLESKAGSTATEEDRTDYPHGLKLITLIIALDLAVFLVALDQTIIATAIPKITDRFNSVNDIGWYGSAYFLTSTALQPTFGKIYKVFPIKWVFLAAITVFEIGSLLCAVAPNSTALIVGRAVAGIGVGGIFSGALIIIAHSGEFTHFIPCCLY
jgi:hypothetical protein